MAKTNSQRADGQERRLKPRHPSAFGTDKPDAVSPEWMRKDSDFMRTEREKMEQEVWIKIAIWLVLGYVGYVLYDSVRGYLP